MSARKRKITLNDNFDSITIKLGDYVSELPKSTLPASVADEQGQYPFICSSSNIKHTHVWLQNKSAVIMGTGGIASVNFGEGKYAYSTDTWGFRSNDLELNTEFLFRKIQQYLPRINYTGFEGSGLKHLRKDYVRNLRIEIPRIPKDRKIICSILRFTDKTIDQTEALINKYQQIKTGLMHDLFSRGLTTDGKLRPPREQAPELYQETPIGWMPKGWEYKPISSAMESFVDGPFGSNLKTEHYVIDPGVRVVRLQNIQATNYNDIDKAYVSERHANYLIRNRVVSGDILIAGLGEDRYPVGRSCQYPENLPPAINKADCFKLRCFPVEFDNCFIMFYLNTFEARSQVRRYEQGVTRPRINLGNMKKILLPKPHLKEQNAISNRLNCVALKIEQELHVRCKLEKQKLGLMHDLLTGKVQVKIGQEEPSHA